MKSRQQLLLGILLLAIVLGILGLEIDVQVGSNAEQQAVDTDSAVNNAYESYYTALEQDMQTALYRQNQMLTRDLSAIQPGNPETIELFFVGIAGDGGQEVFRREVDTIRRQFDRDYATEDRSILLVNSRTTTTRLPLATVASIETVLEGIAAVMNPDQDILFLYLTSHGSADHELMLHHEGITLPDLSAGKLAELIHNLPVKWKVIVISACHSGGFIEPLANDHTLIMTAARADRQSFGCSDEADMTYFGRAYFQQALSESSSFTEAFEKSRHIIRDWEQDFDEQSLPQMHAPMPIREHLDRWANEQDVFE